MFVKFLGVDSVKFVNIIKTNGVATKRQRSNAKCVFDWLQEVENKRKAMLFEFTRKRAKVQFSTEIWVGTTSARFVLNVLGERAFLLEAKWLSSHLGS